MAMGARRSGAAESVALPGSPRGTRPPAPWRGQWPVIGAVAAGGGIGAAARYAAGLLWPAADHGFPWATLAVNIVGCALMGVLNVVISEIRPAHRLLRPFLGTGVLGGFTTFSTYAVDFTRLVDVHAAATGLAYLAATLLGALLAVWAGVTVTREVLTRPRPAGRKR